MTPKEKAKELVDKYANTNGVYGASKQCALKAVDEIKNVVSLCIPYKDEKSYIDYWQQVKHEIEKL